MEALAILMFGFPVLMLAYYALWAVGYGLVVICDWLCGK